MVRSQGGAQTDSQRWPRRDSRAEEAAPPWKGRVDVTVPTRRNPRGRHRSPCFSRRRRLLCLNGWKSPRAPRLSTRVHSTPSLGPDHPARQMQDNFLRFGRSDCRRPGLTGPLTARKRRCGVARVRRQSEKRPAGRDVEVHSAAARTRRPARAMPARRPAVHRLARVSGARKRRLVVPVVTVEV